MLTFFYPKIKAEKFWENVTNNGERGLRVRHLIDLISVPAMICYCQCLCVALPAGWHIASIFSDTQQARQPLSVQLFSTKIWETFGELLRFPPFSIAMLKKSWILFAFHSVAYKMGEVGLLHAKALPFIFVWKVIKLHLDFHQMYERVAVAAIFLYDKIWENPKILSQILYCRFYSFVTHPWNWNRVWNSKSFFENK